MGADNRFGIGNERLCVRFPKLGRVRRCIRGVSSLHLPVIFGLIPKRYFHLDFIKEYTRAVILKAFVLFNCIFHFVLLRASVGLSCVKWDVWMSHGDNQEIIAR
jgi:hypothetical protein